MNTKALNFLYFIGLILISGITCVHKTHLRSHSLTNTSQEKFYKLTSEKFQNSPYHYSVVDNMIFTMPYQDIDVFKWSITPNEDGTWTISSKAFPNHVWTLQGHKDGIYTGIITSDKKGTDNQKWFINSIGGNKFKITSKVSNECAKPFDPAGHVLYAYGCTNDEKDNWIIEGIDGGAFVTDKPNNNSTPNFINLNPNDVYILRSKKFGWCPNTYISGGNISNLVDCSNPQDNLKWTFVKNDDDTYFIKSVKEPSLVWDIQGSSMDEGTGVITYPLHGGNNQRFYLKSDNGKDFMIINKHTQKCARPGPQGQYNWSYTCTGDEIDFFVIEALSSPVSADKPNNNKFVDLAPYKLNTDPNDSYIVKSKKFGWCANTVNSGSNVSNKVCSYANNFQWTFVKNDDDTYFIKSVSDSNLIWDVAGSNMDEGTAVITYPQHGGNNQRFYFKSENGKDFMIINKHTQKCARPGPQGHWDWSYTCTGDEIDFWVIEGLPRPTMNTNVHIINKWNGQCVHSTGDNQQLRFGACQWNNLHYWNIEINNGNFFIKSAQNMEQVFDVTGSGRDNGVKIINWHRHGSDNQRWFIEMSSDNFYEIKNVLTNKCLHLQDNGDIVQWDCNSDDRQLFQIVKPGSNLFPVSGTLINGITGLVFSSKDLIDNNANINFTNKSNGQIYNGNIDYETSTYSVNLPNGTYIVTYSMNNYVTLTYEITINGSTIISTTEKALVVSPIVRGMRATLTWGASPVDLDLYTEDAARNMVYWKNKVAGSMAIDVDDRKSFGPETITISAGAKGLYKVYVRNYSKESKLSDSQANVVINIGEQQVASVSVPSTQTAADQYVWRVGTYNADTGVFTVNSSIQKNP